MDNRICIPSSPEYKDYTLEIVQKLLEPPPNGFDATTTNNKCRFLLYSTTYSMPISSRFAVLCPYYHHFLSWKKNEYSRYTNIMIIDGQTCRPARWAIRYCCKIYMQVYIYYNIIYMPRYLHYPIIITKRKCHSWKIYVIHTHTHTYIYN